MRQQRRQPRIASIANPTAGFIARPRLPVRPRCVAVHAGLDQLVHAAQHAADAVPAALHHAGLLTLGDLADGAGNAIQAATDAAQTAAPAAAQVSSGVLFYALLLYHYL